MSLVMQPSLVVALTAARLRDVDESLSRKLDATTVQVPGRRQGFGTVRSRFGATERRVLGLVRAASANISGPDPAPVPTSSPFYPGPSRYAVLGSAGFELPAYADMFGPTPGWRAAMLRRGTPDPNLSRVQVPTSTFLTNLAARTVTDAGTNADRARQGAAFTMGLAAAVAYGVVAGPVARSAYGRRTARAWVRGQPGDQHEVDLAAGLRLIGGSDPVRSYAGWWPEPDQARDVFASYLSALEATYHLESRPPAGRGWPAFEATPFVPGPSLDAARAMSGYRRLRSDLVPFSMGEWFGLLTPILLMPAITILISGTLPGSSAFIKGDRVSDRSFSELITLADGLSSVTPFIYQMILWGSVDDQPREPFIHALWTFIVKLGLLGGWIRTIGDQIDDPSPAGRWALAGGMLSIDLYSLIRFLVARGKKIPGPSVVFGLSLIPPAMTAVTLVQALITTGVVALAREAHASAEAAEITGWITTGVTGLALWLIAGLTVAKGLSHGGGWLSWFLTDELPSIRGALAGPARPAFSLDNAAVFDDSTLWHDPVTASPGLADLSYPTGGRRLVAVWQAAGSPALEIAHAGHVVKIRNGATVTDVVLGPGARSVDEIVAQLAALDHVEAAGVETGPRYDLPWPAMLADPTLDRDPRPPADDPAHTAFVPLPDTPATPYVLRHASADDLAARYGRSGPSSSPFDGLRGTPRDGLADVDDTVLGVAADLALLLGLGASSRLAKVQPPRSQSAPAVAGPIGPVAQVFRDWNLDHRRANEWRALVSGGAAPEVAPPVDPDVADGARIAEAMGWVPLWRAWVRMAADTTADSAARVVSPDTPLVRGADGATFRPTNAQLTAGVRYLLDLPA